MVFPEMRVFAEKKKLNLSKLYHYEADSQRSGREIPFFNVGGERVKTVVIR